MWSANCAHYGVAILPDDALVARGRDQGWRRIYWHTEVSSTPARRLYDRVSRLTEHVRYDVALP